MNELWETLSSGEKATLLPKLFAFVIPKMESHEISGDMSPEYAKEILNAFIENPGTDGG